MKLNRRSMMKAGLAGVGAMMMPGPGVAGVVTQAKCPCTVSFRMPNDTMLKFHCHLDSWPSSEFLDQLNVPVVHVNSDARSTSYPEDPARWEILYYDESSETQRIAKAYGMG